MLLCICIQISHTRATYPDDDDDDQNLFANNYIAFNNGKNPFEEYYYNKKPINHDDVQLAKRIIMLPRVGRRSTNEK
jgi:hypothetical protein